jgi:hypothetical protein
VETHLSALCSTLMAQCTSSNGPDRLSHKVNIHLSGMLLQLREHLGNAGLAGQPDHDVQLLQLDVDGVVVLDKKHLHLLLKNIRSLLNDEVDIPESDVLHLRLTGQEGDQGWGELLGDVSHKVRPGPSSPCTSSRP